MINKPYIRRLGTIDVDLVETTPLVIGDTLYRFEYIRGGKQKYWDNQTDNSYFRFKDVFHNTVTPSFAAGYHFGSAFHENGVTYVYGVNDHPGSDTISVFRSTDLEHWESKVALHLPGWQLFNTSVCRGKDGYVMAFEMVYHLPCILPFQTMRGTGPWPLRNASTPKIVTQRVRSFVICRRMTIII